jgi:hypothetical protein
MVPKKGGPLGKNCTTQQANMNLQPAAGARFGSRGPEAVVRGGDVTSYAA